MAKNWGNMYGTGKILVQMLEKKIRRLLTIHSLIINILRHPSTNLYNFKIYTKPVIGQMSKYLLN